MIHLNPLEDGVTHLNIYSQGKTELGRMLSNFANTPFTIDSGTFQSVEGYWYWLLTKNDKLKHMHGFDAKKFGRSQSSIGSVTPEKLMVAYRAKVEQTPGLRALLLNNTLPLVHYYVFDGKVKYDARFAWTATLWNDLRKELESKDSA